MGEALNCSGTVVNSVAAVVKGVSAVVKSLTAVVNTRAPVVMDCNAVVTRFRPPKELKKQCQQVAFHDLVTLLFSYHSYFFFEE